MGGGGGSEGSVCGNRRHGEWKRAVKRKYISRYFRRVQIEGLNTKPTNFNTWVHMRALQKTRIHNFMQVEELQTKPTKSPTQTFKGIVYGGIRNTNL